MQKTHAAQRFAVWGTTDVRSIVAILILLLLCRCLFNIQTLVQTSKLKLQSRNQSSTFLYLFLLPHLDTVCKGRKQASVWRETMIVASIRYVSTRSAWNNTSQERQSSTARSSSSSSSSGGGGSTEIVLSECMMENAADHFICFPSKLFFGPPHPPFAFALCSFWTRLFFHEERNPELAQWRYRYFIFPSSTLYRTTRTSSVQESHRSSAPNLHIKMLRKIPFLL